MASQINTHSQNAPLIDSAEALTDKSKCPKTWKVAVVVLVIFALFLIGVVVGFYISQSYEQSKDSAPSNSQTRSKSGSDGHIVTNSIMDDPVQLNEFHKSVVSFLPTENKLHEILEKFSDVQVYSGSEADRSLVDSLHRSVNASGFDDVSVERYDVLLSLPNPEKSNRLQIIGKESNDIVYDHEFTTSLSSSSRVPGFVAFSPPADVQAEVIYLNYGTSDDFVRAQRGTGALVGKIALVRSNHHTRLADQVYFAECHGLLAVLVFIDAPELHHNSKQGHCTDHTPFALLNPSNGGDPLTPGYSAVDGAWRVPISGVGLAKIPVQTLSCQTARQLLSYMRLNGTTPPRGGVSSSNSSSAVVRLQINNQLIRKPIFNVIATIFGAKDSDHSILIGAGRNSFEVGQAGGIFGTDVLLKISSALDALSRTTDEWIPRRTIRFISWGGTDMGDIGLVEFLEKYAEIWRDKVVAYIDLDHPASPKRSRDEETGDEIILSSGTSVETLVKMIREQLRETDLSIPDLVWSGLKKHRTTPIYAENLADVIRRRLPVPYVHMQIVTNGDDDDDDDVDVTSSQQALDVEYSISRIVSLLALTLADSGVLQLQVHSSAQEVVNAVTKLVRTFAGVLPTATAEALKERAKQLKESLVALESYIVHHLAYEQYEEIRVVNGVLLQVDGLMTRTLMDASTIQNRYTVDGSGASVTAKRASGDACDGVSDAKTSFLTDVSVLITRLIATTKVTVLSV